MKTITETGTAIVTGAGAGVGGEANEIPMELGHAKGDCQISGRTDCRVQGQSLITL